MQRIIGNMSNSKVYIYIYKYVPKYQGMSVEGNDDKRKLLKVKVMILIKNIYQQLRIKKKKD